MINKKLHLELHNYIEHIFVQKRKKIPLTKTELTT